MPHIKKERQLVCTDLTNVKEKGEMHFFFGKQMEQMFLQNPCYDTISNIRYHFVQTAHRQDYFKQVRKAFKVPLDIVLNEAALAWEIFKAEIVERYEQAKAIENGHAYDDALKFVINKTNEAIKNREASQIKLVLPNEVK